MNRIPKHHTDYIKGYLSLNTIERKLEEASTALYQLSRIENPGGETTSEQAEVGRKRATLASAIRDECYVVSDLITKHPLTVFLKEHAKRPTSE